MKTKIGTKTKPFLKEVAGFLISKTVYLEIRKIIDAKAPAMTGAILRGKNLCNTIPTPDNIISTPGSNS